jgi:hypothetical protein
MPEESKFEHKALEADMQRLAREIQASRERPELKHLSESEILRQSLQTMSSVPPPGSTTTTQGNKGLLPAYVEESASPEVKLEVEHLLSRAFREGILKASDEAAKSSPFVLDAFHDALAGRLYPELKKRGILK